MAITIALDATFTHLMGDRSLKTKQNSTSREREAVVTITVGAGDTYTTNGVTLDFTQIRLFSQVYLVNVCHNGYVLPVQYIPAAGNAAATGKMKFFDSSGAELGNGSAAIQNKVIKCIIRGI